MKAVGYRIAGSIERDDALVDIDRPMPVARSHDLLVAVKAVSVNPVDTKVRRNAAPEAGQARVLGWDAVGIVEAVGDRVTGFRVGDRVYYAGSIVRPGANSELHAVDERIAARAPASLDDAQAAAWLARAASHGLAYAQNHLGALHYSGRGVPPDHALAARWFRRAAQQGDRSAQYNLGLLYRKGRGVTLSHPTALSWFYRAAEQGMARAQAQLAHGYLHGLGVTVSHPLAMAWYRKAALQGHVAAQVQLAHMYARGLGVTASSARALYWYRHAAGAGNPVARRALGLM